MLTLHGAEALLSQSCLLGGAAAMRWLSQGILVKQLMTVATGSEGIFLAGVYPTDRAALERAGPIVLAGSLS